MPTIRFFGESPTYGGFGHMNYRNGRHFEDVVMADFEPLRATNSVLVLDDPFQGLEARFNGRFTYANDGEVTSFRIDQITFFNNGERFQVWTDLGWTEDDLGPVIEAADNGDRDAFEDFLDSQVFRFILDDRATSPGVIALTEQDDRFIGEAADPYDNGISIFSYGGDDVIDLRARLETAYVDSGKGNDIVKLGDGFNQVRSGKGKDDIRGGAGEDNLDGEDGRDIVNGGAGDDVFLSGGRGNDIVRGGAGDDHINDERGTNRIFGGDGDDFITGRGFIAGGAGDDTMSSSARGAVDTFDFRLRGDDGFGRDTIFGNFHINSDAIDRVVFDEGVEIDHRVNENSGRLVLEVSLDGEFIGRVGVSGAGFDNATVTAFLNNIEFV